MRSPASCGGEMLRTGRVAGVPGDRQHARRVAGNGGDGQSQFLLSDVQVLVDQTVNGVTTQVPTIFNDTRPRRSASNEKNPTCADDAASTRVTLTRYRVDFRRTDGRNTPGVDVPYGFDGGLRHRRSAPAAPATWPSRSSAIRRSWNRPCSNLAGVRRPGIHFDHRRDHVLWPRPERQRSHRHWTRWTCSLAISPTTIVRTSGHRTHHANHTSFVSLLGARRARRPSPGAPSRMSTSRRWPGRRRSRNRSS